MEFGLCRSGRTWRSARTELRGGHWGSESEMTGAGRGGKTVPLGYQEPISCNTQGGVMVEPARVTAFKVSQPQLLFQLLVIPFDDPRCLAIFTRALNGVAGGSVASQYFVGSGSLRGHSISNHSSA